MTNPQRAPRQKVLLVIPNYRWGDWDSSTAWKQVPYSLCLLAAAVEKDSEVRILDSNFEDQNEADFSAAVREFGPDVVGISIMMDHYAVSGHKAAALVKQASPRTVTVFGGVYATTNPAKAAGDPNIDFVVAGEGEEVFWSLLAHLRGQRELPTVGVWRKEAGKVVEGGLAPVVRDLDSLPLPAYHLIDFARYGESFERNAVARPPAFPYGRIITSRGCPGHCVFCQVRLISGMGFRVRSAKNVLAELAWLRERHGIRSFMVDDDNFFANKPRAKEILKGLIASRWGLPWIIGNAAVNCIDDEMLGLMQESGCAYFNISIESGSARVLREIVKKPQIEYKHAFHVVRKAREHGIDTGVNFIVGFPGETWDEIRETLRMAEDIDADYVKIFAATPLPNTDLHDLAVSSGALLPGFDPERVDWKRAWIQTKEFTARDLAILRAYEWDRINFAKPEKRRKIAEMMQTTEAELLKQRRQTLDSLEGTRP